MKKFLTVVLTMVFTLSMAGMAMAANTNSTSDPATVDTNYTNNFPNGYGAGAGGLSTSLVTLNSDNDNPLNNANNTGLDNNDPTKGVGGQSSIAEGAVKNVAGQRTHGEYANNTNSCASCHQVHTGAASNLLFKDGVYQTCTACHDGTLGVLNVFAGSTAGTFGGTSDGHASMHLADGVMEVKAAPGGNHNATKDGDGNDTSIGGAWAGEFDCASCHSPHGSYSDRLLNYNPNNIGDTDMYFRAADGTFTLADGVTPSKDANNKVVKVRSGGMKVAGAQVQDNLPTADADSDDFVVYRTTAKSPTLKETFTDKDGAMKDNTVKQETQDIPVIVLMKKVSKADPNNSKVTLYAYVRDMNPWMGNVYNTRSGSGLEEATNFYKAYTYGAVSNWKTNYVQFSANPFNPAVTDDAKKDQIIVKFAQAYIKDGPRSDDGINVVQFADISRATVVKFDLLSTKATFNNLPVKEVDIASYSKSGYGVQISQFCAACHTDYFVSAGTDASGLGKGVWSKAFRHNTTSDTYTCLKCHFAHGTDVSVMLDAKDQSVTSLTGTKGIITAAGVTATADDAKKYMLDNNASSALKRYTNMSVCWKCHTSSHSEDLTQSVWYQGSLNSGVKGSSEYTATADTTRPAGWVDPTQTNLPYAGNQLTATYNK